MICVFFLYFVHAFIFFISHSSWFILQCVAIETFCCFVCICTYAITFLFVIPPLSQELGIVQHSESFRVAQKPPLATSDPFCSTMSVPHQNADPEESPVESTLIPRPSDIRRVLSGGEGRGVWSPPGPYGVQPPSLIKAVWEYPNPRGWWVGVDDPTMVRGPTPPLPPRPSFAALTLISNPPPPIGELLPGTRSTRQTRLLSPCCSRRPLRTPPRRAACQSWGNFGL